MRLLVVLALGPQACARPTLETPALARNVTVGEEYVCALTREQQVVCWGEDVNEITPPADKQYIGLDASSNYLCAIDTDQSLSCRSRARASGAELEVVANTPSGFFRAVAVNYGVACALTTDGQASCWWPESLASRVPDDARFLMIDVGTAGMCGLMTDGSAVCYCADDDCAFTSGVPEGVWEQLTVGVDHGCVVDSAGAPTCWGRSVFTSEPEVQLAAIDAGDDYSCGLTLAGEIVCWTTWVYESNGSDSAFESEGTEIMEQPAPPGPYVDLAVGVGSGAAITADHDVVTFGWPISGSFQEAAADR